MKGYKRVQSIVNLLVRKRNWLFFEENTREEKGRGEEKGKEKKRKEENTIEREGKGGADRQT